MEGTEMTDSADGKYPSIPSIEIIFPQKIQLKCLSAYQ